jgi:hypothetical protein
LADGGGVGESERAWDFCFWLSSHRTEDDERKSQSHSWAASMFLIFWPKTYDVKIRACG